MTLTAPPHGDSSPALTTPGTVLPLGTYLKRTWELRHYAIGIGKGDVESSSAETTLGKFWLIGEPLLFVVVYTIIFGVILEADRGVDNFVGYLAAGRILFRHHRQAMLTASMSTISFEANIQAMAIPRIVFPLASVLTVSMGFTSAIGVLVVMLLATGESITITWLWMIPILLGQIVLNAGIGLILARVVAHFRDLTNIMPHLFRFAIYGSGVVFSIQEFVLDRPNGAFYMKLLSALNPIYDYIHLGRWALMGIQPASPEWVIISAIAWSVLSVIFGVWFFRRVEQQYGFGRISNAP